MPSSPDEDLALIETFEPAFIKSVEAAVAANGSVCLLLDSFKHNREFVAACLWYALDRGVLVTVVPRVLMTPLPTTKDLANLRAEESA